MHTLFHSSFGVQLTTEAVVRAILDFMRADDRRRYKLLIGTDSERREDGSADFVTAVVVHRVGNGGRYFWRRQEFPQRTFHSLRERIVEEVLTSLEAAKEVLAATQKIPLPEFDFEIHVDVGENGETRAIIQELVSMVRANKFEAKTKPDSYAASKVADRHV